jgi:hypothetical protein
VLFNVRCVEIVTFMRNKGKILKSESHRSQSFARLKVNTAATQSIRSIDGTKYNEAATVQYGLPLGSSIAEKTMPVWKDGPAPVPTRDPD